MLALYEGAVLNVAVNQPGVVVVAISELIPFVRIVPLVVVIIATAFALDVDAP